MPAFDHADSPKLPGRSVQVDRMCRECFGNPDSPRPDEVRQLLENVLLRDAELESKVGHLERIVQQLEAYRDRYVDLYELAPLGYATLDEDGYVQEINVAGLQLLGFDRDALIGQPFEQHVQAKDRNAFLKQVQECCHDHHIRTVEVGLVAMNGQLITAQLRGVPLESLKDDVTFCKLAITDITERKRMEEALRASEANYRTIFDTANDAIFIHDADTGAILDTNQKTYEMFGYTPAEFRHLSIEDFSEGIPPYTQADALRWLNKARDGSPQLIAWKCRDKAGRLFWVEVNIKRTVLNGTARLLAVVRDITDRKQAEETLRESEERFRTLADYTYDWEYWRGPDGRFRYVSPSCQRITGHSSEEFMADAGLLERILHPEDRERLVQHFRSESPTAGPYVTEFRIIAKGGEERWIEHICQPVYGDDQRWLGQRASNRDITKRQLMEEKILLAQERLVRQQDHEREEVEAELAKATDQLIRQTRLAAIGQVSASIAHELRNPLAVVRNAAFYLKRRLPKDEPKWIEYLDMIEGELNASNRIISNLMEAVQGKQPKKERLDLGQIVREVFDRLPHDKEIRLSVQLDPESFIIAADPVQFRQVLENLVGNSIQAMRNGGDIRIRALCEGDWDTLILEDDGPGIPQELRSQIFEPLVTTKPKGTGLGLAICRQIIQRHGGAIRLLDTDKPGAAFQIRLPCTPWEPDA